MRGKANISLQAPNLAEALGGSDQGLSDLQALRCIMAAIMYSEIRHERYLSHNLEEVKPGVLYAATFEAVDGLIEESTK